MAICKTLHLANDTSTSPVSFCRCPSCGPTNSVEAPKAYTHNVEEMLYTVHGASSDRQASDASSQSTVESDVNNNDDVVQQVFDPTGMYYWCPPRALDSVLLVGITALLNGCTHLYISSGFKFRSRLRSGFSTAN